MSAVITKVGVVSVAVGSKPGDVVSLRLTVLLQEVWPMLDPTKGHGAHAC